MDFKNDSRTVFICWSYHHILVSTLLAMKLNIRPDIVLIYKYSAIDPSIKERLSASGIYNNVFEFEEQKVGFYISKNVIKYLYKRYIGLKLYYLRWFPTDLASYKDVILFVDFDSVAAFMHVSKISFHLIEDAKKVFSKESITRSPTKERLKYIYPRGIIKLLQKNNVLIPIYGNSRYCSDITVDSLDDLILTEQNKNKFHRLDENELLSSIDEDKRRIIIDIFGMPIQLDAIRKYTIILSEPLAADNRVKNEKRQIECYKEIIDRYCIDTYVIIKPHPRDLCDYTVLEDEHIIIAPRSFPSEILTLIPNEQILNFITITSSAVFAYDKNKQVYLGNQFLEKYS